MQFLKIITTTICSLPNSTVDTCYNAGYEIDKTPFLNRESQRDFIPQRLYYFSLASPIALRSLWHCHTVRIGC